MNKISGFADEISKDFDTQISVLQEIGQEYIELRSADGIGIADMTLEKAQEIKRKLDQAKIKVSALGSPIGKIMITDDFGPHLEQFYHVVELAEFFETPYIRMFSFFIPEGERAETHKEEVFVRMKQLIEYAEEKNVVLLHENEKDIYGDTWKRCLELMEEFGNQNFRMTFDFANFVQCDQNTMEAFEALESYVEYVHIKDAKEESKEVVLPGDGDGNVKAILETLQKKGFSGFLSLEPHLVSFAGLEKLEKNLGDKVIQDGIAAYKSAHQRLLDIVKE